MTEAFRIHRENNFVSLVFPPYRVQWGRYNISINKFLITLSGTSFFLLLFVDTIPFQMMVYVIKYDVKRRLYFHKKREPNFFYCINYIPSQKIMETYLFYQSNKLCDFQEKWPKVIQTSHPLVTFTEFSSLVMSRHLY